jgi:predicted transcriptional regulator
MTRKLTIELPDELEQRLLAEAQRLNTSLENFVVQSLALEIACIIAEIMQHIQEAETAGRLTTDLPASAIVLHLAGVLKNSGLIADFQLRDRETHPHIQIHLNPNNPSEIATANPLPPNSNNEDFPEEMVSILRDLENEDPAARVKAVAALGER